MAPARRHRIGASRRRREDEGEDEGSTAGHVEEDDDSMSDGSLPSHLGDDDDADGEGSDVSEDESSVTQHGSTTKNGHARAGRGPKGDDSGEKLDVPFKPTLTATVSDTEAMMNGLKISAGQEVEEIEFDSMGKEDKIGRTPSAPPTESRRETFAERKRREHEEYIKARDENPAFVPTRGGFFLHDKRSTDGHRSHVNKSKSRPYGLIVDGNVGRRQKTDASDGQWTHDLHDTVVRDDRPTNTLTPSHPQNTGYTNGSATVTVAPRSTPPNRSFSTTLVIGNVPVRVFLPGMEAAIPFAAVPKRQHTRLPQHRPPLRRDKPVRVSLPGAPPKYILPAPERSFIFIPRALRPNQQSFRGRGRGGYYTGRRPSFYQPGSVYSPSISMSRRSSLREGMHSPAASVLSRQNMATGEVKPIVRLPPSVRPPGVMVPGGPIMPAVPILPTVPNTAYRETRGGPMTMHQPRPQKTVSLADIESPASFNFNPPQPQQEQPFHQQVPVAIAPGYGPDGAYIHGRHPSHPSQPSGTPLSHIPERAIHAAPFQPYGVPSQPAYYAAGYAPGALYYPVPGNDYPHYTPPAVTNSMGYVPPPPHPSQLPPGPQAGGQPYMLHAAPPPAPPSAPPHTTGEQAPHAGTVAHEANGTVYFYDAQELYHPNTAYNATGGVVGMGGMMTPPGTTYYYPQSSGVYYPQ
ncbi:hypothetical protein TCE0_060r18595 [Talaromyces pinophilus]|uniref:Btz domain-containing protein n=1 Tax=Talaromyces pinophilus TaxID=128442 RepID=A0A6V8HT90_TALPI|nr:hypothetical protein TCE0_060r18595 [Talaromyces pinophilus]